MIPKSEIKANPKCLPTTPKRRQKADRVFHKTQKAKINRAPSAVNRVLTLLILRLERPECTDTS